MKLFDTGKRKRAMNEFADQNNLIYFKKDEYGLGSYFKGFKLFGRGGAKGLTHLTLNTNDSTASLQYGSFDYTFVISTGKSTMVFIQTVFFWLDQGAVLPQFYMFPEKWYHKWGTRFFGMQDLDFKSYPKFSDQFVLQSKDPDFTTRIFNNEPLIAELREMPKWTLECEGYYTIMYIPAKQQKPEDMVAIMDRGHRINTLLRS